MNLALWIVSGLLAAVALTGGAAKAFVPGPRLATTRGAEWTEHVAPGLIKLLGLLELLAAAGLILPVALGIAPVMARVTAGCWVALMIGAAITHGRLGQTRFVWVNMVYLALAVFVVWGR